MSAAIDSLCSFSTKLLSSGSESLTVNGSVTPVVFSAGPGAGQSWNITSVTLQIATTSNPSPILFGGITQLTNGCVFRAVVNSNNYSIMTLKNNQDIITLMPVIQSYSFNALLGSTFSIAGGFHFDNPLILNGNTTDRIQLIIQDNLTALYSGIASVQLWRTIP